VKLLALGLGAGAIKWRLRTGRLHRIHRGVYAVGHAELNQRGRWLAAVLACGKGAVLSHRSAGALYALVADDRGTVHVTIPRTTPVRQPGITAHRSSSVFLDAQTRHAIPVTTVPRTLRDLKRTVTTDEWNDAVEQAEIKRIPTGLPPLRTRSKLERQLKAICRRHRLPPPQTNVRIGHYLVDALWRRERLIVEVDGWHTHGTHTAFVEDRQRDRWLHARRWRVARFTYDEVFDEPARVAAELRVLLAQPPAAA
jgi:very-short-patch-repair endonuclease